MAPPSATRAMRCGYCAALLTPGPGGWQPAPQEEREEPIVDPARTRLWIGGLRYAILGKIARGDASDVFMARRDARITELVVIKVLRAIGDLDLLAREQEVLEGLEKSTAPGTPHMARLLPQRVDHGIARVGMHGDDGERRVSVFRWRSGFVHTIEDVLTAYSKPIDPAHAVWMWKRVLEQLAWAHQSGVVHGSIAPAHALVHARDHGVVLIGWSRALRGDDPSRDIAASARMMMQLVGGGDDRVPETVPAPLAQLMTTHALTEPGAERDAWALRGRLDAVARECFGPPRFVPFPMPGWD
jgi:hypothetical protein